MTTRSKSNRIVSLGLFSLAGACGFAALSQPAAAQRRVGICIGSDTPVWVPARYETRERVITLPPLYEEVTRRVWRDPVYRVKRSGVGFAREGVRRGGRHGRGFGHRTTRRVMRPSRRAWQDHRILVSPGYWDTVVERILARPARTKVVHDRILVRQGHWVDPPCRIARKSRPYRHAARFMGGIGYRQGGFRISVGLEH